MAVKEETRQGILVDLDSILDTRLGTLARLSDEIAEKTLHAGYHSRDIDVFDLADMQQYRDLYAQRDSLTLSKSMCTGVIRLVRQLAAVLTDQAITRPYHSGARIVVNLHPYSNHLSMEEKDEIHKAVEAWMQGTSAVVELASFESESLTPELVRSTNIAAMFMYHYDKWMDAHAKAFESTRLGDISLFGPALYSLKPTEEELSREIKEAAHPFTAIEMLASPLIHLQLIPVKHFSVIASLQ